MKPRARRKRQQLLRQLASHTKKKQLQIKRPRKSRKPKRKRTRSESALNSIKLPRTKGMKKKS